MENLLSQTDRRHLLAIEILYAENDWITLAEIAKELNCSARVLKSDIAYFKEVFDEFTIEGSNKGVRLVMNHNFGLRSFYQYTLEQSDAYNLIEYVFLNEGVTVVELTKYLSLGSSTVYRLLDQINGILLEYGFQIETNPCQFVGSEKDIRYFFYNYFREKYSFLAWPYVSIPKEPFNQLLNYLLNLYGLDVDYSYYHVVQTVCAINIIRYKHGHRINIDKHKVDRNKITPEFNYDEEAFLNFEEEAGIEVNDMFLLQVFSPYIQDYFSPNYAHLIKIAQQSDKTAQEVTFLKEFLNETSKKHALSLTNLEEIILDIHNLAHLEYQEPRSGYVFNNYTQTFAGQVEQKFPSFYRDLYEGIKEYRQLMGMPITKDGINFLIHVIFTRWPNLLTEFRKKFESIKLLVLSDRHISHAQMVKDLIEYEFSEKIVVDVYEGIELNEEILKEINYDIIVANFPLPATEERYTVNFEALPTFNDILKIRNVVDDIYKERIQARHKNK